LNISGGQAIVKKLLNIIKRLASSNDAQESELQKLRDEINRLKGEQGKPDIKAKKKDGNLSSEAERKEAEANTNKDNSESGEKCVAAYPSQFFIKALSTNRCQIAPFLLMLLVNVLVQ
jgi:phosphoenolpyruvate carboxylase